MDNRKILIYLAVLVPRPLSQEITEAKLWLKRDYGVSYALRNEPHVTIIPPMWVDDQEKAELVPCWMEQLQDMPAFSTSILRVNHFRNKVLFLELSEVRAWRRLKEKAATCVGGSVDNGDFHPHITLANRDTGGKFEELWNSSKNKKWQGSFTVEACHLMVRVGSHWEPTIRFELA